MKKTIYLSILLIVLSGLFLPNIALSAVTPINLSDFSLLDPSDPVVISSDGTSATISEDAALFSVILINDPFFGDPNVIIPGVNVVLRFDYEFTEPSQNDDEFGAFIFDADTGLTPDPATDFEFFIQDAGAGTVSFDLTSLTGLTLGLQFELASLPSDNAFNSSVTVSNVRLLVVPIPSALLLFASASISLFGFRETNKQSVI